MHSVDITKILVSHANSLVNWTRGKACFAFCLFTRVDILTIRLLLYQLACDLLKGTCDCILYVTKNKRYKISVISNYHFKLSRAGRDGFDLTLRLSHIARNLQHTRHAKQ